MIKGSEVLATGKKRTKVVATLDNGNALLSKQEVEIIEKELEEGELAITYTHAIFELFDTENNGDFIIDIIAKQKKALEIIKNKIVDMPLLFETFNYCKNGLKAYNTMRTRGYELTKEEYDLLKEVLL